jgi:hypothetical protein
MRLLYQQLFHWTYHDICDGMLCSCHKHLQSKGYSLSVYHGFLFILQLRGMSRKRLKHEKNEGCLVRCAF